MELTGDRILVVWRDAVFLIDFVMEGFLEPGDDHLFDDDSIDKADDDEIEQH